MNSNFLNGFEKIARNYDSMGKKIKITDSHRRSLQRDNLKSSIGAGASLSALGGVGGYLLKGKVTGLLGAGVGAAMGLANYNKSKNKINKSQYMKSKRTRYALPGEDRSKQEKAEIKQNMHKLRGGDTSKFTV